MSASTLVLGGLTIEGFFDRSQTVLTLIRDGQVVSRVPRDLYLGCFALTVESGGQRWTLEADANFHCWRRQNEGVVEGTPLRGWLLAARGTPWQRRRQWWVGFAVGFAAYIATGLLLATWLPTTNLVGSAAVCMGILAVLELYQLRRLRQHLDRQAALVVAV